MATASVPNTFVVATTIDEADMNANFTSLVSFLNSDVVHVDGSKAMSGALNLGNNKITSLGTPTANADAATKLYVDGKFPVAWGDVNVDWAETADLAIVSSNASGGVSTEVARGDHAHELVNARNIAVQGGTVRGVSPNPTTSFQNTATAAVAMPSNWNSALVIAWGDIVVASASTASMQLEGRISIDTSTGPTNQSGQPAANNARINVSANHDFVTSEATINIQLALRVTTGSATLKYSQLTYLIIRAS